MFMTRFNKDYDWLLDSVKTIPINQFIESDNAYILTLNIPGVDPGSVEVSTCNDVLTIRVQNGSSDSVKRYTLPRNSGEVTATLRLGVLTVSVAKPIANVIPVEVLQ